MMYFPPFTAADDGAWAAPAPKRLPFAEYVGAVPHGASQRQTFHNIVPLAGAVPMEDGKVFAVNLDAVRALLGTMLDEDVNDER